MTDSTTHQMIKIESFIAYLVENEPGDSMMTVVNPGPLKEGPLDGTKTGYAIEGVAGVLIPDLGFTELAHADWGDATPEREKLIPKRIHGIAEVLANKVNKRVEKVRFGPNGREHIAWIYPKVTNKGKWTRHEND